jgi:hypothetical protein
MKSYQFGLFVVYALITFYLLYQSVLYLFVYFANKKLGHEESFRTPLLFIVVAFLSSAITASSYFLLKNNPDSVIGNVILFAPIVIAVAIILWTIFLIIASGGRWN